MGYLCLFKIVIIIIENVLFIFNFLHFGWGLRVDLLCNEFYNGFTFLKLRY
jgi:hypothetical protein